MCSNLSSELRFSGFVSALVEICAQLCRGLGCLKAHLVHNATTLILSIVVVVCD